MKDQVRENFCRKLDLDGYIRSDPQGGKCTITRFYYLFEFVDVFNIKCKS